MKRVTDRHGKRHGPSQQEHQSFQRTTLFQRVIRSLKRNSARIALSFLMMQILYIFFKLNVRALYTSSGTRMGPDYMYNYMYDNERRPRDRLPPQRLDAYGRDQRNAKPEKHEAAAQPKVQYEEDYDHLDYEAVDEPKHEHDKPDDDDVVKEEPKPPPLILAPLKVEPVKVPDPPKTPKPSKPNIRLCTMQERLKHLESYCNRTDTGDKRPIGYRKSRYGGFVVDEKHKMVFCDVSQMASIVWTTVLAKATGQTTADRPPIRNRRFMNKIGLRYLDSYTNEERDIILKNYFKFLVVQHPFDRLVSQWRSKLVEAPSNEPFKRKLGHQIILSKRRVNNRVLSEDEISSSETTYFDEFVEFVFVDRNMIDPSWFTYLQVCHPCEIQYSAILRVETFKQDANVVLSRLSDYKDGIPDDIPVPSELDVLHGKYNIKSFRNVSTSAQDTLLKKFQHDIGMFGYSWNVTQRNASCSIHVSENDVCC